MSFPAPKIADQPALDAAQIAVAAAALASHFQRLGIHHAPAPRAEGVADWRARLDGEAVANAGMEASPADVAADKRAPNAGIAGRAAVAAAGPSESLEVRPTINAPGTGAALPPSRLQTVDAISVGEGRYASPALALHERESRLAEWASLVAGCTRCPALAKCRKQTVFGEGSAQPRVVFFGEGPGAEEDRTGRPFVGKAGELLTKMIEACTFARDQVYILNTVKCRPPNNRNPEPVEVQNCREYFEAQLEILRPEYIVCLGAVSSQALLGSTLSIGRLRGRFHRYCESKVVVTYHPAYLLRNPSAKKAAWEDLQGMLRDMGIAPRR